MDTKPRPTTHTSFEEIFSLENHNICRESFGFEPHQYALEVVHDSGSRAYSMGATRDHYARTGLLMGLARGIAEANVLEWDTDRGEFVVSK